MWVAKLLKLKAIIYAYPLLAEHRICALAYMTHQHGIGMQYEGLVTDTNSVSIQAFLLFTNF